MPGRNINIPARTIGKILGEHKLLARLTLLGAYNGRRGRPTLTLGKGRAFLLTGWVIQVAPIDFTIRENAGRFEAA